ncbi:Pkinase-domain-containing protein [Hesseltinella vesiculosa]|uniref:Pkinase-domain-containing protein n=1 Tax=Hesseltinella vesiculosa TaxID=101127 RepID=A0A1X2G7J1_9FUNG|nr:Pkinase-domain-containing protein [Hesseltinella vesiculosa]
MALKRFLTLLKKLQEKEDTHNYPKDLLRQYKVTKKTLGVGSFAVVKECIHRHSDQAYALKIIMKSALSGRESMLDVELDILKQVQHPNIISMHDLFETDEAVYIITDLALGGELFQQLLSKGSYTEKDAAHLVTQILNGVAYLHDHDIIHRDIKPENLLFQTTATDANLMITDFGLSKILKHHDDILMTACGTPGYVSPEVLLQKGYNKPADLWSVGVITYILLVGYTPFYGADQSELFASIMKGEYDFDDQYWHAISDQAKNFIDGLLAFEPEKRLTAVQALDHPWISKKTVGDEPNTAANLLGNVRRGLSNGHLSFRSALGVSGAWPFEDAKAEEKHPMQDTNKKDIMVAYNVISQFLKRPKA